MKTVKLLAVAIATVASIPLMTAQQLNTGDQQSVSASAGGTHVNESASTGASASAGPRDVEANGVGGSSVSAGGGRANATASGSGGGYADMRPVAGELESRLDSKTAKAGDRVVLKTSEKVKTADGTVIPKGSRLVGHVTEVEAHEKGHAASQVGIVFDRAEMKGGRGLDIHSMIQSVQPSAGAMSAASMADEGAFDTPVGGGGGAVGGGGLAGGRVGGGGNGLLGGTAGGVTSATGRVGSDLGPTTGSLVRTSTNLGGEATGSLAHGVSGAASGAGALGARATGIPGIMLNGDATGFASGTLSATNRNVHLESGTQMVLGIAAAR